MKKILVFAVILALLVPAAAFAATEFSLGGFIKLDTFWDSTQESKNMNLGIARNNAGYFMHGRTKFTAQGSRFNFTIKGPKLFGAQTTGFIEMDFDENEQGATTAAGIPAVTGTAASSSNNYIPRLRHAMFRFNWPETELLLGQYWSMFCEWYPELVEDGPFQGTGTPTARIPQIRLSQKFLGWGTASFLLGNPNGISQGQSYSQFDSSGQSAIVPQLQGKLQYQQNVYGQAPYYGKPTPLTVQLVGGWQRSFLAQSGQFNAIATMRTWGNNAYGGVLPTVMTNHQNMDPWLVMASAFVPVIPTQSANLAGTASILAQWWVGSGVDAFGFTGSQNFFRFNNSRGAGNQYDVVLQKRFGGQVQGQYYFNNQWFITAAYGMSTCIDGDLDGRDPGARLAGAAVGVNPETATTRRVTSTPSRVIS